MYEKKILITLYAWIIILGTIILAIPLSCASVIWGLVMMLIGIEVCFWDVVVATIVWLFVITIASIIKERKYIKKKYQDIINNRFN